MTDTFRIWNKKNKTWLHPSEIDDINDLIDINYYTDKTNPDLFLEMKIGFSQYEIVFPDIHPDGNGYTFIEPE